MLAHRVGAVGAIVAVVVLSLELAGALAWKHRATQSWELLHGTELTLGAAVRTAPAHPAEVDAALEQVMATARSLQP